MIRTGTILVLLLSLVGLAPAQDERLLASVPLRYRADVERALLASNDKALRACREKLSSGDEREAWAFLLASLPRELVDTIEEAVLTEHIRYGVLAWRELPWAEKVPKKAFLHWVLPFQPGDIKAAGWRKKLYDELLPVLVKRKALTLERAALEVNRWCGKKKDRQDEAAVFFVKAARAMGIPARIVRTPWWTHKRGGGEWCEVYVGRDDWRFLAPCEPEDKLGKAPFAADTRRAAVVFSKTIGKPDGQNLISYHRDDGSVINSIAAYRTPCRMTLEVKGPDGKPAADAGVCMYIFNEEDNNAWMRPAFQAKTDPEGRFAFDLGPGDFLFHAKDLDRVGWAVARSKPGGKAHCTIAVGKPATDARASYAKDGNTGLRLFLGSGGGGDMTAAVSPLEGLPWDPFTFVGDGGQFTSTDPGFYSVLTSWRPSAKTVLVSVQSVEVRQGETTTLRAPDFPKSGRKASPGAWVLTYPSK